MPLLKDWKKGWNIESGLHALKENDKIACKESYGSSDIETNSGEIVKEDTDLQFIQRKISQICLTVSDLKSRQEGMMLSLESQINKEIGSLMSSMKEHIHEVDEKLQAYQNISSTVNDILSTFNSKLEELGTNQDNTIKKCEVIENSMKNIQTNSAAQPRTLNGDVKEEVSSQLGIFLLKLDEFYIEKLNQIQTAFQTETQNLSTDLNKLKEDTVIEIEAQLGLEKTKIDNNLQNSKDQILSALQADISNFRDQCSFFSKIQQNWMETAIDHPIKKKSKKIEEKIVIEKKLTPKKWYREAIKVIEQYPPIHKANIMMKFSECEMDPTKIKNNIYYKKYLTTIVPGKIPDNDLCKLNWNLAELIVEPNNIKSLQDFIKLWFTKRFIEIRTVEIIRKQLMANYHIHIGIGEQFPYRITYLSLFANKYKILTQVLKSLLQSGLVVEQQKICEINNFGFKFAFDIKIPNDDSAKIIFKNGIQAGVNARDSEIEGCLRSIANAVPNKRRNPVVRAQEEEKECEQWEDLLSFESKEPLLPNEVPPDNEISMIFEQPNIL